MNKKAQGLSTNAIILIVLGVIVLVILAIGFLAGWDKIAPWIKPTNNVQTIVDACSMACSMNSVYDYCSVKREVKLEEQIKEGDKVILDKKGEKKTCDELSKITQLRVGECPAVQPCSVEETSDETD